MRKCGSVGMEVRLKKSFDNFCRLSWEERKSSLSCAETFKDSITVRLRLRVLLGCVAGHNAVFDSTRQATPGHAVQKT